MTNITNKPGFEKLSKKEHLRAICIAPLMLLSMPFVLPYTLIRNTVEGSQTVRGWAEDVFWELKQIYQVVFFGGYANNLGEGSTEREKVRKFRKTGTSKTLCKAFAKHFGSWSTFANKSEKYLCYKWTSEYSEEWVYLTCKGKDRYTFSHTDYSYGSKSKKPNIHCDYQLTEEQALAVLEAWAKQ